MNCFNVTSNTLKEEEKLTCEGLLTEDECFKVLKEMKNPGSDGITVEFYKTFWDDLNQYLVDLLDFSFVTETRHYFLDSKIRKIFNNTI